MKLEHKRLVSLRYCIYRACLEKEQRHPQEVMRSLGIKYEHATPMSVFDMWVFWLCNIPSGIELPSYLTEFKTPISEMEGHGLSQEIADRLMAIENADVEMKP